MNDVPLKRCPKCGEEKPAEFFSRDKRRKDGLNVWCKACVSIHHKAYHQRPEVQERVQAYQSRPEVQEQLRAAQRRYLQRHPEQVAARIRARQEQGYWSRPEVKERRRAYNRSPKRREWKRIYERDYRKRPEAHEYYRAYAQRHPAKRNEASRKAYRDRPYVREHKQAYKRIYYSRPENKERRRTYAKNWYGRPGNKERVNAYGRTRRARKNAVPGTHTAAQIQELLKRQKYRCYYAACGHAKFEKVKGEYLYHVDHTFPISRVAGTTIPANDISYLVLTCPTCNESKHDKFPWEWPEGGKLL